MCKVRRGNFFFENKSSSFFKATDLVAAGGAPLEITTFGSEDVVKDLVRTSLAGTEQMALGSGPSSKVPIGIPQIRWDRGHTTMHVLGLGSNSSYLNALVQAGQIPSRVWSFFWGRTWTENNDQDGSLVLGGYDNEKVIGRNYTQKLDYSEKAGCWTGMRVRVSDLLVNFFNSTNLSVLPGGPMDFCIVPQRQLLFEAPKSMVDAIETAANLTGKAIELSFSFHRFARVYNVSLPSLRFDLTFVLESGLQVRVPSNQWDIPHVNWDRSGARVIDRAKREFLMNGLEFQDANQPITLGRYFFTAAYLMVDHDASTFTMWQGAPTTRSNLVPVLSQSRAVSCGNNGNNETIQGSGDTGRSLPETGSTNVGAIAGGVAGGVVLAVLAVGALLVFRLHRRASSRRRMGSSAPEVIPATLECSGPPLEVHGANIYENHGYPVELVGGGMSTPGMDRRQELQGTYIHWPGGKWELDGNEHILVHELNAGQRRGDRHSQNK